MPQPIYHKGDRVVQSIANLSFNATVLSDLFPTKSQIEMFRNQEDLSGMFDLFDHHDPDWERNPIYVVVPDSSPGPASLNEVRQIIDYDFNEKLYNTVMNERTYVRPESFLLPIEHEWSEDDTISIQIKFKRGRNMDAYNMLDHAMTMATISSAGKGLIPKLGSFVFNVNQDKIN